MGSVYSVLFWITGIIQTLIATFFLFTYGENVVKNDLVLKLILGFLMLVSLVFGLFVANKRPGDCETDCDPETNKIPDDCDPETNKRPDDCETDTYNQVFKNLLVIVSFLFIGALYRFDILEFNMVFSIIVLASIIILYIFYSINLNNISCMCDKDIGNNLDTTKILFGVAGIIQFVIYVLFLIPRFGNFLKTSSNLKSIVGISLVISLILGLVAANRKPPECELEGRDFKNTQYVMNTVAIVSFLSINLLYRFNVIQSYLKLKIFITIILVLCSILYCVYATNVNGIICLYD